MRSGRYATFLYLPIPRQPRHTRATSRHAGDRPCGQRVDRGLLTPSLAAAEERIGDTVDTVAGLMNKGFVVINPHPGGTGHAGRGHG